MCLPWDKRAICHKKLFMCVSSCHGERLGQRRKLDIGALGQRTRGSESTLSLRQAYSVHTKKPGGGLMVHCSHSHREHTVGANHFTLKVIFNRWWSSPHRDIKRLCLYPVPCMSLNECFWRRGMSSVSANLLMKPWLCLTGDLITLRFPSTWLEHTWL